jgi:hypothetical protein
MQMLLNTADRNGLSDWEIDFLQTNLSRLYQKELSYRQAEKLLELRDDHYLVSKTHGGFCVKILVSNCHECRVELDEDDPERVWLEDLFARRLDVVSRKDARRLERLARLLGELESETV